MSKLGNPKVHYAIAGVGDKKDYLLALAKELGVSEQLHLLGYRKDIPELNHSADLFCFPSLREGLGVAAIEAMACGLPLITSDVHGINDYSINGETGLKCSPNDVDGFSKAIESMVCSDEVQKIASHNKTLALNYDIEAVNKLLLEIYCS